MTSGWFEPVQSPGHRFVELVQGPSDGAVIEVGQHVSEWAGQDGRYTPREGFSSNLFFWDPVVGA